MMVSALKGRREMGRGARVGDVSLNSMVRGASLTEGEIERLP